MSLVSRKTTEVRMGDGATRYSAIIESAPCIPNTLGAQTKIFNLFRLFVDNPALLDCRGHNFETLSVEHTGDAWLVTATATVEGIGEES